jgi:hypothetical protein
MDKAHEIQKNTAQSKSETNELATRIKINSSKQKGISSYTQQHSNPYGPMEFSYGGQPSIPTSKSSSAFSPGLSDQFRIHINNHRIHADLQMNTVISEIKKWNTKHLRKLENRCNALAVNLLDNSKTTHRLKRYTVLTLPDRPE